ncbi:energy-coupling factor transporter transmembrane component T family protein [Mycobacteroides franklinii]|uniref:energy-coupling factor transporter transmembrane component T family protein n=1 Tax=Mycobacteroides franklinii TaxID=948102 RepID=UPI000993B9CA|nr:energy-coupling factor transporter transmembrane protein EcfT [Mycobacteroides franklinii]
MSQRRPLMLMRPVPGPSPIHALWAGTKLIAALAISVLLTVTPSWIAIGLVALLILSTAALAGISPRCIPSIPRGVWLLVVAGSLFTIVNGGAPELRLGPATLGVGGFLDFLRVTSLGLVLIGLGAVISWTTQVAEIAPAVALLCRPLRILRVPIDDWAVTISLAFRMFPMLSEEFRLLAAARRLQPPQPEKPSRRAEVVDLCTAAMVVSLRRATEMGDAITARGGAGRISAHPIYPGWRDVLAAAVLAAVVTLAFLLG